MYPYNKKKLKKYNNRMKKVNAYDIEIILQYFTNTRMIKKFPRILLLV